MKSSGRSHWVIAVDGGGSKIAVAAQLCDAGSALPSALDDARLWSFAGCGSAHPAAWPTAQQNLADALHAVFRELILSSPDRSVAQLVFALAGAGRTADQERVRQWASALQLPIQVSSITCVSDMDPLVDFFAVPSAGEPVVERVASVAVILGTGSIVGARDSSGRFVRAGGWGPQLGDECSGGAIGLSALKRVVAWIDAGCPGEPTSGLVVAVVSRLLPGGDRQQVGTAPPQGLERELDQELERELLASRIIETASDRAATAQLAQLVLELAFVERDDDASALLKPHLERLSWQIEQVIQRIGGGTRGFQLVFSGGLAAHCAGLRGALLAACEARRLVVRNALVVDPVLAGLRLAVRMAQQF